MTTDEMEARLVVLETVSLQALLVAMSIVVTTRGIPEGIAFLDEVKASAMPQIQRLRPGPRSIAKEYLDGLLAQMSAAFEGYRPPAPPAGDAPPT